MKVNAVKWINLILVLAVLAGYEWYAGQNEKKRAELEKQQVSSGAVTAVSLRDGQYHAQAQGFGGPVEVQVTIENGKITKTEILSAENETPDYLKTASVLLDQIVDRQSADIDTVSGATFSSRGILDAAKKALEEAHEKTDE